jgi:ABC-type tungstate transport system substrate-binding protein
MAIELREFFEIVGLSIGVSLAATAFAAAVSLPFGTALAIVPFRGRRMIVVLVNAFFGLPPVVVGLVLYLALSRSGPLGFLELLFTPMAMVIAQATLAIPIMTALVHRASERYYWRTFCRSSRRRRALRSTSLPKGRVRRSIPRAGMTPIYCWFTTRKPSGNSWTKAMVRRDAK